MEELQWGFPTATPPFEQTHINQWEVKMVEDRNPG